MAVYFPRGQQTKTAIRKKFVADAQAAAKHSPEGMAFVTNQELVLEQRETLRKVSPIAVEFFHLERIAIILDLPAMASVRSQFLAIPEEAAPNIQLGGHGGTAPGAGGGGGGALGKSARGGPGGKGGSVIYAGSPGRAPGAGGGGAGAEGENAQGGGGGDGGQRVHGVITGDLLAAMHRMEFRVGEGGKDGGPGSDTILNIVSEDGKVLESIAARGGKAGKSAARTIISRPATEEDVANGLRVTSLLLADCVHLKNGLPLSVECRMVKLSFSYDSVSGAMAIGANYRYWND
jgi:hypothetical protein